MKKKKKKGKIIILIIIIFSIHIIYKNNGINNIFSKTSEYETIKKDINIDYQGKGQEKIKNKDGYFSTFTTTENEQKTYIEYKQNGNSSWSNKQYWGGTMAENGCGITAIATILSGYNRKYTPEELRQKYYPSLNYESLSEELANTFNIKNSDFYYDSTHLSKEKLQEHLKTNRPILICVWNKPNNNRWTTASHYMVLLATDDKDMVYISNPNGGIEDYKSSGWYKFKEVTPYIAKALYIESYN
ncbi:MAG: hypothetical protein HFJ55_03180 [Clostridia bacterium]|nr:hypothetical protein [Clostridia bacterium]